MFLRAILRAAITRSFCPAYLPRLSHLTALLFCTAGLNQINIDWDWLNARNVGLRNATDTTQERTSPLSLCFCLYLCVFIFVLRRLRQLRTFLRSLHALLWIKTRLYRLKCKLHSNVRLTVKKCALRFMGNPWHSQWALPSIWYRTCHPTQWNEHAPP